MKFLQELLNLEESQSVFIQALKNKTGKILGYYIGDDEDVTNDPSNAKKFSSKIAAEIAAENDAEINNKQWDLGPGEKFVVLDLKTAKII